jgi:hypothetical protein
MIRGLLASTLVLLGLILPALADQVSVHGYTENGAIDATIDGQRMTVPDDMANRHRQMIAAWEADGNTILPYVPPAPSTDPKDYPLTRVQFMAMLDIAGLRATAEAQIDAIEDPVQRAIARSRYENSQVFNRNDPLLVQLVASAGLTAQQIDGYWMQATALPAS